MQGTSWRVAEAKGIYLDVFGPQPTCLLTTCTGVLECVDNLEPRMYESIKQSMSRFLQLS
jgi:hypothetical protein